MFVTLQLQYNHVKALNNLQQCKSRSVTNVHKDLFIMPPKF